MIWAGVLRSLFAGVVGLLDYIKRREIRKGAVAGAEQDALQERLKNITRAKSSLNRLVDDPAFARKLRERAERRKS